MVERKPRLIHVYEFLLLSTELPRARFRVRCTKGTYVRTLCADVGTSLGCGAHLEALCRTASSDFTDQEAHPLANVLSWSLDELKQHILPMRRFARSTGGPA